MTVRPSGFLTPSGPQLQHRQHGSVLPDPPQADLAGQPLIEGPAVALVHRDRAARASQRLDDQRLRGRGRHAGAKQGDQGRTPLCRRINASRTRLVTHHDNDLISCRQPAAAVTTSRDASTQPGPQATLRVPWISRASTGNLGISTYEGYSGHPVEVQANYS
jgi:hypothetical protein